MNCAATIKKITITLISFLAGMMLYAQSTVQWERCYGGTTDEIPYSIVQGSDGNYVVAGLTRSYDGDVGGVNGSLNYLDVWMLKVNPSNGILWKQSMGGSYDDYATCVITTKDGGYAICAASMSNDINVSGHHGTFETYDFWIIKTDVDGNIQWQQSYGGSADDIPYSIKQTSDGGYVVGGYSASTDGDVHGNHGGTKDYWVLKLNSGGGILWSKCFGGSGVDVATSVIETYDHSLAIAGYSFSNDGDVSGNHGAEDIWMIKLDANGVLMFSKSFGGANSDQACSMIQTLDSGYAIAGFTKSNDGDISSNHGEWDYWLLKLDASGNLQFQKTFGGTDDDRAFSMIQLANSHYVLSGESRSANGDVTGNHGEYDEWIIETDAAGKLLWQQSYGGNSVDVAGGLLPTADDGFIILGGTESNASGDVATNHSSCYDYWLIKMNFQDTAKVMRDSVLIYPNPSSTNFTICLATYSTNEIVVISDVLGREIYKETLSGILTNVDVSKWNRGVYFYSIRSNTAIFKGKVVIWK